MTVKVSRLNPKFDTLPVFTPAPGFTVPPLPIYSQTRRATGISPDLEHRFIQHLMGKYAFRWTR